MSRELRHILAEAADDQVERWWADIREDRWPSDMPIPMEAFHEVWHSLQKRVIDIKPKPKE